MGISKQNRKSITLIFVLLFLFLIMTIVSLLAGAVKLSWQDLMEIIGGDTLSKAGRIFIHVRIPRVLGGIIAGMGLATAGAIIQVVLNNPLAGPNIIGVNSGAGFAVVLCGVLLPQSYKILPFAAFAGAFVTVVFVFYLGKLTGSSKITLVLAGVAINSLLNSATDAVFTFSEESLLASNSFKIGGLKGIDVEILKYSSIIIIAAIIIVLLLSNELEILSLGEEKAKTLGLWVSVYRLLFLALAAALAGASISFAGLIGFIGLIVPHIARLLVGEECKYYILTSALLGALLLLCCDTIGRTLFAPYEIPVGIILSFVGAPFFLWLLSKKKNRTYKS